MSYLALKLLACITMLIDHMGLVCVVNLHWLDALFGVEDLVHIPLFRLIGRVAFPIFAFMIANGFRHTKNIRHYFIRLLIFAFISEIPFNLMLHNQVLYIGSMNVFFTLIIGLLCIQLHTQYQRLFSYGLILSGITLALGCVTAVLLGSDYTYIGVLTVFLFGIVKGKSWGQKGILLAGLLFLMSWKTINIPLAREIYDLTGLNLLSVPGVRILFLGDAWLGRVRLFSLVSLIPIFLYNQKLGLEGKSKTVHKIVQYFFYCFYPFHMLALWAYFNFVLGVYH